MKFRLIFCFAFYLFLIGCSGGDGIDIKDDLSAEEQQIMFRKVLDNQYKAGDYKNAFANFEKIAAQGNPDAAFFVAVSYSKGRGVKRDRAKAIELLKDLADKGYPAARDYLANELKVMAKSGTDNKNEWLEVVKANAEKGELRAWEDLAKYYQQSNDQKMYFYYLRGLACHFNRDEARPKLAESFLYENPGNRKDLLEAVYWLFNNQQETNILKEIVAKTASTEEKLLSFVVAHKEASELDKKKKEKFIDTLATAFNRKVLDLGPEEINFALDGMQKKQYDAISLVKLYLKNDFLRKQKKLLEAKNATELYHLAIDSYKLRSLVFRDLDHAYKTLALAAELGNTDAMLELGRIYCADSQNAEAFKKGMNYLLSAAMAGDSRGYTRLAGIFDGLNEFSESVKESIDRIIISSFEKGVDAKDPEAMAGLAKFLLKSSGDRFQARIIELLEGSVAGGNLKGAYELARLKIEKGKPEHRDEALTLLESSAAGGISSALELLFQEFNKDCNKYSFKQIRGWLNNYSREEKSQAYLFLMQHYLNAGKYRDAYRWVAASYLTDFNKWQQKKKADLNKKICQHLSPAETQTIMFNEVGDREQTKRKIRQAKIQAATATELSLLVALLSYGFFEGYGNFEDFVELRPIFERLKQLGEEDPEFFGFFLAAVQSRSYSTYYNPEAAFTNFKKSAELGNPYAMLRLAKIYQRRAEKLFHSAEADYWIIRAAETGLEGAKLQLGFKHLREKNYDKAFALFFASAKNNNPIAKLALASLYETGLGTNKDIYQAMVLYQNAAQDYLCLYPFYQRAKLEWSKAPGAEATGEFKFNIIDPAQAYAAEMIRLDTFFDKILEE